MTAAGTFPYHCTHSPGHGWDGDRTIARMKQALACALALIGSMALLAAGPRTFTVEPDRSNALIDVGKTGAFSFAGHTHEVEAPLTSGVVHLDPDNPSRADVRLEFNAAAMRVTGKGESPDDVPKVTQTMLSDQVLDVKKYPSITFESTGVTRQGRRRRQAHDSRHDEAGHSDRCLEGRPATSLTATGKFTIKQTDFGIKPISVGGVVKVKDELNITFTIAARER